MSEQSPVPRYRTNFQGEMDSAALYHALADAESNPQLKEVYSRLAALVPPPSGVTRQGILNGDKHMRDLWWNALGLGDTSWWRMWERDWPSH